MVQQSLYRRYRPSRFGEVRGQDHVVEPLRNAVRNGTAGQAYLFSGPRGTGKTTTARILAKALNCENLLDGEPCCECTACIDMQEGRSFDLFELDAASNNGVDAIRSLVESAAIGSPGRTKVYILDEVHMLSTGASNALLKTLEEPPDHVRFVLATTDPHKVLPTIRSRTQHFDFQLLSAEELESQVRDVVADAGLDVGEEAIAWAVQQGRGSSRDTLSALDKVAAAGGIVRQTATVDPLFDALAAADVAAAMVAVADALGQGVDPKVLASAFIDSLRDAFMVSFGAETPHLVAAERSRCEAWATSLGTPLLTRAMESVGTAIVDMHSAPDPRVPLEVALVQLTSGGASPGPAAAPAAARRPASGAGEGAQAADIAALVQRIEHLERALAEGGAGSAPAPRPATQQRGSDPADEPAPVTRPADTGSAPPARRPASVDTAEEFGREAPPDDEYDNGGPPSSSGGGPAAARAELARLRSEREGGASASKPAPRPVQDSAPPAAPPVPGGPPQRPKSPASGAPPTPPGQPERAPSRPPAAGRSDDTPVVAPVEGSDVGAPGPAAATDGSAAESPAESAPAPVPADAAAPTSGGGGPSGALTSDHVQHALADKVVPQMKGVAKAIYGPATVEAVVGDAVTLQLLAGSLERAEKSRAEVESALSAQLGRAVKLSLTVAAAPGSAGRGTKGRGATAGAAPTDAPPDDLDEDIPDVNELEDAPDVASSGIDRLTQAFPGAQVLDQDEVTP